MPSYSRVALAPNLRLNFHSDPWLRCGPNGTNSMFRRRTVPFAKTNSLRIEVGRCHLLISAVAVGFEWDKHEKNRWVTSIHDHQPLSCEIARFRLWAIVPLRIKKHVAVVCLRASQNPRSHKCLGQNLPPKFPNLDLSLQRAHAHT